MLVAPTEPAALKALGTVSLLPEERGCDVIWRARGRWFGVQRKAISDFVASMQDGRLVKEVAQMKGEGGLDGVCMPAVVIEGNVVYTSEGELMLDRQTRVTRAQIEGRCWSLAREGVHVYWTVNVPATVEWVKRYAAWSAKAKHASSALRPGPTVAWGTAGNRDWALHTLQSFPGVGVDRAGEILASFGRLPLRWDVSEEEMMKVKGLGKKTVRGMYGAFEHEGMSG